MYSTDKPIWYWKGYIMILRDIIEERKESRKIALKYGNNTVTFYELHNTIQEKVGLIKENSISTENIGIFLPNSIQYVISYFVITFLEKVIVPIGPQDKKAELQSIIHYCELNLIVTNTEYKKVLKTHFDNLVRQIVVFNLDDNSFEEIGTKRNDFVNHRDVLKRTYDENSSALMLHTSGTTSNPKRVMLTHKNLLCNVKSIIESLTLSEKDITLIALPMHLASANTSQLLTHLYLGASIVISDSLFLAKKFFNMVQENKITNFTGVPFMLTSLLDYRNEMRYDIRSLKLVCFGGAPLPAVKIGEFLERFPHIGFVQMYGQTEASTRITHFLPHHPLGKIGSAGKTIPGIKLKIVDDSGKDVDAGEIGEIVVHGDNVMEGYYKRQEETEKALKNGWLYTGDLGRLDQDGFLYITGRKRNVIIRGGMNIYPEEIEEILCSHPDVVEAYVQAERHELLGEVPIAKVAVDKHSDITEKELLDYCCRSLSVYKVPSRIIFTDAIPKTYSGKVLRR